MLDLKQAYFHIPIKESDRDKTAFMVPWGKVQWRRLALGLVGAPFTFGEAMAFLFKDFDFVVRYFDDILIFSDSVVEHFRHFQMVLDRLAEYGFLINDDKCQLFQEEVLFLGYRVSGKGIRIDAKKIQDVTNFNTPSTIDDLRKFLGITGFLRKFINNYGIEAAPLYDLLKKKNNFNWTPFCNSQFNKIKGLVQNANMLVHPDFNKPFIVGVDASKDEIGFYLGQIDDGNIKYVTFGGRTLTETERWYPALDKELLAIFYAVKTCYVYLCRHDYVVYSDHQPLTENFYLRDIYG